MDIKFILIDYYGYSEEEAEAVEKDLSALDERVAEVFEMWKTRGQEYSDVEFNGYSVDRLRADYSLNFFAALLTLDWIVKDTENALFALSQGIM